MTDSASRWLFWLGFVHNRIENLLRLQSQLTLSSLRVMCKTMRCMAASKRKDMVVASSDSWWLIVMVSSKDRSCETFGGVAYRQRLMAPD